MTLIAQVAPASVDATLFSSDQPASDSGLRRVCASAARLPTVDQAVRSPDRVAAQTIEALGLEASADPDLRACDYGRWSGRLLADVAQDEPERFAAWLRDASVEPPGGESAAALIGRVGAWLDQHAADGVHSLVVAHPAVIRAAVVHAALGTAASWFHIDIGFASKTVLNHGGTIWRLQQMNASL